MNEPPNFEAAPTVELFTREMERLVGTLRPGRNVQDFQTWAQEIKARHGHEPYGRLRRAINLVITQTEELPAPVLFAMFLREAERQLAEEKAAEIPRLPLDEERQERERNETYAQIYKRVGIGTEPFEWNLCRGIAKGRRGDGREPSEAEVEFVYQKRRSMGITVGRWETVKRFPSWNREEKDKDDYWTPAPPTA